MKLKAYREQIGLTQVQLATVIGVSNVTVHRWERGRMPKKIFREALLKLSNGKVTPNDFM